jgi:hypothetical protein
MRSICAFFAFYAVSVTPTIACSNANPGKENPPAKGLEVPPADKGLQLGFKAKVDAGKETVVCRELVVAGDAAIEVERLEHESSPGTHHIHVYRSSTPAEKVSPGVFECGDLAGPLVYTTQKARESTRFPPGVGVKLGKGEVVRLELHYLNTTGAAAEAELQLNLWFARSPLTAEAGSFFMYDHDIAVPAHGTMTTRMHCEIPADISIMSLLPHVHTHGRAERMYLSGKGLATPKLLVDSRGFGDLETRAFDDTPIAVKAGQALDFECDFKNDGESGIIAGASTTKDEMCMILGSYYPRLPAAAEWCTLPGSGPIHAGNKTCEEASSCADANDDDEFEKVTCALDVCEGSSRALNDVTNCGLNQCTTDCPGEECKACVAAKCQPELGACTSATCGG